MVKASFGVILQRFVKSDFFEKHQRGDHCIGSIKILMGNPMLISPEIDFGTFSIRQLFPENPTFLSKSSTTIRNSI